MIIVWRRVIEVRSQCFNKEERKAWVLVSSLFDSITLKHLTQKKTPLPIIRHCHVLSTLWRKSSTSFSSFSSLVFSFVKDDVQFSILISFIPNIQKTFNDIFLNRANWNILIEVQVKFKVRFSSCCLTVCLLFFVFFFVSLCHFRKVYGRCLLTI